MKTILNLKKNSRKGFTLFIALIVTSILLTVGFSIGNIILRQLRLSTSGRESQVAFYAADAAAECALYWDRKDSTGAPVYDLAFGTSTPAPSFLTCGTGPDGSGTTSVPIKEPAFPRGDIATTTFYVDYRDLAIPSYKSCAKVVVVKNGVNTSIDARGYNSAFIQPGGICDITDPRTVERGLLLQY